MMLRYSAWSRQFGADVIDKEGRFTPEALGVFNHLKDLTMWHIKQGLELDLERNDQYPPSLPQFRMLCKPQASGRMQEYQLPPCNKTETEEGRKNLVALRQQIKKMKNFGVIGHDKQRDQTLANHEKTDKQYLDNSGDHHGT